MFVRNAIIKGVPGKIQNAMGDFTITALKLEGASDFLVNCVIHDCHVETDSIIHESILEECDLSVTDERHWREVLNDLLPEGRKPNIVSCVLKKCKIVAKSTMSCNIIPQGSSA